MLSRIAWLALAFFTLSVWGMVVDTFHDPSTLTKIGVHGFFGLVVVGIITHIIFGEH